jgi:hypothetical protein
MVAQVHITGDDRKIIEGFWQSIAKIKDTSFWE